MYGRLSGLFRPDGYASRGMRLSQLLSMRRQGRRGDSMLSHVNPREAAVLRQMGGSGGMNPNTGLREFAPASKDKSGGSIGGTGGGVASKGTGAKSSGVGTVGSAGMSRSTKTGGTIDGGKPAKTGGIAATDTGSYANPAIGSEAAVIGHMQGDIADAEAEADANDFISRTFGSTAYDAATGIGGLANPAVGAGMAAVGTIAKAIDSLDAPRDRTDVANDLYGGGRTGGFSGGGGGGASGRGYDINDVLTGAARPPIAPPPPPPPTTTPNPNDPDPIVPEELLDFIEPGMTEEQIRAMIATYATNANNSYFQSPDVFDYYAGLLRPAVNSQGYGAVKPIEHQYLNQTFGLSYDPTVQALLTALGEAGLPATPTAPPPSNGGNVRLNRGRRH